MRILYVHGWYMKQPMYLLFIWGGTSVTGFPAIAGVRAIASIPTSPGIPILAVGFIYRVRTIN